MAASWITVIVLAAGLIVYPMNIAVWCWHRSNKRCKRLRERSSK